jgi:hypothetical protein
LAVVGVPKEQRLERTVIQIGESGALKPGPWGTLYLVADGRFERVNRRGDGFVT